MSELTNIKNNVKGEKPSNGQYEIIRVRNTDSAKEVLRNFKEAVTIILKNIHLNDEDPKWEKLLPQGIVSKLKQLDEDDLGYDELLYGVNSSVYSFLDEDIKKWEWYSSLEVENGFDIFIEGYFNAGQFISFIHCQNVPLANIRIIDEQKGKYYELKTIKDYTTYKTLK